MGLARSDSIADKDVGGGEGSVGSRMQLPSRHVKQSRRKLFQRFINFPVSQPYFYVPLLLSVNIFIIKFIT